jgi:hypothetical protein
MQRANSFAMDLRGLDSQSGEDLRGRFVFRSQAWGD